MSDSYTRVEHVMVPDPQRIDGLASVAAAITAMRENRISSLVVDKRHASDEYGLVVVSDIANQVIGRNRAPERTNIYEIMSKPTLTVDVNMDIKYAIRLLGRFGVSRSLVTQDGELVGIVTLRDMVLRYLGPGSR